MAVKGREVRPPPLTWLILCLISTTGRAAPSDEGPYFNGDAVFTSVGKIAAPVYYLDVMVQVDLKEALDLYEHTRVAVSREIAKFKAAMAAEGRSPTDVRRATERITGWLHPHLGRLYENQSELDRLHEVSRKRFIAELLGIGASLIAIGSAIHTHAEVKALASDQVLIKKALNVVAHDVRSLRDGMKKWKSRTKMQHESDDLLHELVDFVDRAATALQAITRARYALMQHQADPALFSIDTLEQLEEQVQLHQKETKATPVFSLRDELLAMPISWIVADTALVVIFHVPFVQDGARNLLDLVRLDGAILEGMDKLIRLESPAPFLALDSQLQHHYEMSGAELQACHRYGKIYLCEQEPVLLMAATTCTSALYYADTLTASRTCPQGTLQMEEPAVRLNSTTYAVEKWTQTTLHCPGKQPVMHRTRKIEVMRVPRS